MPRRPRVFISYSHDDQVACDGLANWLSGNGFQPTFDRDIHAGGVLTGRIIKLIEDADFIIALGTASSFASQWVREEVQCARHKSKPYAPIVLNSIPEETIPPWFTGHGSPVFEEVKYLVVSQGTYWSELAQLAPHIRKSVRLDLRTIVVISSCLAFILPIGLLMGVRPVLGTSGSEIRERQAYVEEINKRLDRATLGQYTGLRLRSDGGSRATWYDEVTATKVADDITEGTSVRERHFYLDNKEFAVDHIYVKARREAWSMLKTRAIMLSDGSVVEDTFDSVGNLMFKRVRRKPNSKWINYSDISRSIYPSAYRYLGSLLPGPVLPGYR